MSKKEFIEKAKGFGYSDAEIDDFIQMHNEYSMPFEDIVLIEHIVD